MIFIVFLLTQSNLSDYLITMIETKIIQTDGLNVNGRECCANIKLTYGEEDQGIGPYEYWGAKGIDCNVVKVEESREILEGWGLDEDENLVEIHDPAILQEILYSDDVDKEIERELDKE